LGLRVKGVVGASSLLISPLPLGPRRRRAVLTVPRTGTCRTGNHAGPVRSAISNSGLWQCIELTAGAWHQLLRPGASTSCPRAVGNCRPGLRVPCGRRPVPVRCSKASATKGRHTDATAAETRSPQPLCWSCPRGGDLRIRLRASLGARLGASAPPTGAGLSIAPFTPARWRPIVRTGEFPSSSESTMLLVATAIRLQAARGLRKTWRGALRSNRPIDWQRRAIGPCRIGLRPRRFPASERGPSVQNVRSAKGRRSR
jgi:hypothetical protein